MKDQIGSSHMTQGNLTSFTSDRFGCVDSALALNGGWTQVPSGVYFDTPEFTISVWILPRQVDSWARIIDFGPTDFIYLGFIETLLQPFFELISGVSQHELTLISSQLLQQDTWQFIAITFDGKSARFYLGGQMTSEFNNNHSLPSITRLNCYIGKSNVPVNGTFHYSFSYLDDLRFFNKSLTQKEINDLMNQNRTSKIFKNLFFLILSIIYLSLI